MQMFSLRSIVFRIKSEALWHNDNFAIFVYTMHLANLFMPIQIPRLYDDLCSFGHFLHRHGLLRRINLSLRLRNKNTFSHRAILTPELINASCLQCHY